jgi:hypothetical protein
MMAAKRYKLTQAAIDSVYTEGDQFSFKVGFLRNGVIVSPKFCPKITITDTDVVQTTNEQAQQYLELFKLPRGIDAGAPPPPNPVFVDVTGTEPTANVDLDPYFV